MDLDVAENSPEETSKPWETEPNLQTSPGVLVEQRDGELQYPQLLSTLCLKLSKEESMKFARLKVMCLRAEGRLIPGDYRLMVETYAKQIQLCWYTRKIQRINAMYRLRQLIRLKSNVTEELSLGKYMSQWIRDLLNFRDSIMTQITNEQRKLAFLLQFITKEELIREDRVLADLVVSSAVPRWQWYVRLKRLKKMSLQPGPIKKRGRPKNSEPQKLDYEDVINDIVNPLVISPEQYVIVEDTDEFKSCINRITEGSSGEIELRNSNTISTNNAETLSQKSTINEAALQLEQYNYKSLPGNVSSFTDKKHIPTIVCRTVPASTVKGEYVISVTSYPTLSLSQRVKSIMNNVSNKAHNNYHAMIKKGRPMKRSATKTVPDETTNNIVEKNHKSTSSCNKRKIRNNKCQSIITACIEKQLKTLCLTRKCVVMLERLENSSQYE